MDKVAEIEKAEKNKMKAKVEKIVEHGIKYQLIVFFFKYLFINFQIYNMFKERDRQDN